MKALKEANINRGVDIITQADYDNLSVKSTTTLYIIVSAIAASVTINNVYVGTESQNILLNNDGAVVWASSDVTAQAAPATVPLTELV